MLAVIFSSSNTRHKGRYMRWLQEVLLMHEGGPDERRLEAARCDAPGFLDRKRSIGRMPTGNKRSGEDLQKSPIPLLYARLSA